MDINERLRSIKYINPQAHCVVWEGGIVKYDPAHIGVKPTLEDCKKVLPIIHEQMALEEAEQLYEEKIQEKLREIAIRELEEEEKKLEKE